MTTQQELSRLMRKKTIQRYSTGNIMKGYSVNARGQVYIDEKQYIQIPREAYKILADNHPRIPDLMKISKSSVEKFDFTIECMIDGEKINKTIKGSKLDIICILYPNLLDELHDIINNIDGRPLVEDKIKKEPDNIPLPESIEYYNL